MIPTPVNVASRVLRWDPRLRITSTFTHFVDSADDIRGIDYGVGDWHSR